MTADPADAMVEAFLTRSFERAGTNYFLWAQLVRTELPQLLRDYATRRGAERAE